MTVFDSFTVDGINDVTFKTGDGTTSATRSFDDGFMGYVSQFITGGEDLDTTVTLTGTNWTVAAMRFGADGGNHVTITDADDGSGRGINYLRLGNSSDVTLTSTRVNYVVGNAGGDHNITLGSANTRAVNLFGDNNTVTTGSGYVGYIESQNISTFDINGDVGSIKATGDALFKLDGNVDSVELSGGNHELRLNSGSANYINLRDGVDNVILKSSFGMDFMKTQNNTVDMTVKEGGRLDFYEGNASDSTIVMESDGRIRKIDTVMGSNDITTGDRWVDSFNSWESVNTIHVGTGGIGTLAMGSDSALHHSITTDGWLQFMSVSGTDTVDLLVGDGGAGAIYLGDGDDTVETSAGFVDLMNLGNGANTVKVGAGGGVFSGGDDDDMFEVSATANSVTVDGGDGIDTIDFSQFLTVGVTFSLDKDGRLQNVGSPGDFGNNVAGYFAESSVENIIGGKKGDNLEGDAGDNYLQGKGGKDKLRGGEGNDTLRGDGSKDVFVFGSNAGTDLIEDFTTGDRMKIKDHTGGFESLTINDNGADLEIIHDGGTILLGGLAGFDLSETDFIFL